MPEPLSIATAAIGTALGVLGFVVSTLSSLNRTKRSIIDFTGRIQLLIASLKACEKTLQDIDALWGYDEGDETFFGHIWGQEYMRIRNERQRVAQAANGVAEYVTKYLGLTDGEVSVWTDDPSQGPGRLWLLYKRLRYALFSEETMSTKVTNLEKLISNLSRLYDARQKTLLGENPGLKVSPKHVRQLEKLYSFGSALWDMRRLGRSRNYSQWTVELWPLGWDGSTNFSDWGRLSLSRVHLWLSFRAPPGPDGRGAGDHRVRLDYDPSSNFNPTSLAELLTDPARRGMNGVENPQMRNHSPLVRRTRTFRQLFAHDNFFTHPFVYKAWQPDLAQLLVSLTNWSALFWITNWTTNICPSGIRYVRATRINSQISEPCLHTLSHRRDHEPGGARVEDGIRVHNEYDTCIHGGPVNNPQVKLRNLGLAVVELICTRPFRFCEADDSQYEQWCNESSSWTRVTLNEILGLVERKSGAVSVREIAHFCLASEVRIDEDQPWDGHATFIHEYTEKVIQPLQAWASRVQVTANHLQVPGVENLSGIPLRRWPQDAFEDQEVPPTATGPWIDVQLSHFVKPTYARVGGVICFVLGLPFMFSFLLAWLTAGPG
ncbi:hypothetical protein QBC37DRAFT_388951 [Rhypophila decipiens]|uniref:Uncharacterized protein n=1 Tax=Rhypophila decipiens TaxID=261697 RepID=A0AAN6Y451_9PEZI|nr:hypothetical protein QBC37DRAFT_388951 [Rhypophila decipiens]